MIPRARVLLPRMSRHRVPLRSSDGDSSPSPCRLRPVIGSESRRRPAKAGKASQPLGRRGLKVRFSEQDLLHELHDEPASKPLDTFTLGSEVT